MTVQAHRRFYQDKVVLITGGAGAIGSNLCRAVALSGARLVMVLDDLSSGYAWNIPNLPNVLFVRGSVTDEQHLKRVFTERPDVVFHLAALFANQRSVDQPNRDLTVNGMGTLLVYQYSQLAGVKRVVYSASGCSVYGNEASLPLQEDSMSMRLSSPYQITKMLGELYANYFHSFYGLPVVKLRLFNSYGPGEVSGQYRNVIPNFIYKALRQEALPLTGHPEATRDFTFVEDVVDAMLRAGYVDSAVGQEINIGSGRETRIGVLAEKINSLTDNPAGTIEVAGRGWDTKRRILADITRAREILGFHPRTDIDRGLEKTVDWFRQNWDEIQSCADFPPGMSSALRPASHLLSE